MYIRSNTDGKIVLNKYGNIAQNEWLKTAEIRNNVKLDVFVVMPNHVHGILVLTDDGRGTARRTPTNKILFSWYLILISLFFNYINVDFKSAF